MRLLGLCESEPTICGVCARRAMAVGVHQNAHRGGSPLWVCAELDCIQAGNRIFLMPTKELDAIERRAIAQAASFAAMPVAECVLNTLYDAGVRNLDDVTPDKLDAIAAALAADDGPFRQFLTHCGEDVKAQIFRHEPPF